MDVKGEWAKRKKGKLRVLFGHEQGVKQLKETV